MHRIVKAHLNSYVQSQGLAGDDESEQFEKFVNFAVLSNCCPTSFDIDDISTGPGDDGCDGVAVVIDEEIISSSDFAEEIFKNSRIPSFSDHPFREQDRGFIEPASILGWLRQDDGPESGMGRRRLRVCGRVA